MRQSTGNTDGAVDETKRLRAALAEAQRLAATHVSAVQNSDIGVWTYDLASKRLWFSDIIYRQLGLAPHAFPASFRAYDQHVHPDDQAILRRGFQGMVSGEAPQLMAEVRVRHTDGSWRWVRTTARVVDLEGEAVACGTHVDITDRRRIERERQRESAAAAHAQRRLAALADNAPSGLYELRRSPSGVMSFPYFSESFARILGVERKELEADGMAAFNRVALDDLPELILSVDRSRDELSVWRQQFRVEHPEHGPRWLMGVSSPQRAADGAVVWSGNLIDVTDEVLKAQALERARSEAETIRFELETQAAHDPLTGLPNRHGLTQAFDEAVATGAAPVTLVRIDLDRFKYVNDTFGQKVGDMFLCRVADILRSCCRPDDVAARVGGDEFSVLIEPGAPVDAAHSLAARIQQRFQTPFTYQGRTCRLGVSIGIATTEGLEIAPEELPTLADIALSRAKELGRGRVELFTPGLHSRILDERKLAFELQDGIERGEIIPYFQAQVDAQSGGLLGAEALARWRHPKRGVLAPGAFLPLAERLGLVGDLDRAVFEATGRQLEEWAQQGLTPPKISLNVSAGRIQDAAVVAAAQRLASGPTRIAFELLETILVEAVDQEFLNNLSAIRDAGVAVEIDDFGSGHASVVGLTEIRPDALKIDRQLVTDVAQSSGAARLVAAIVEMADALDIAVTAEGVETDCQAAVLARLGVKTLQGYYFARPEPAETFATRLAGSPSATC